MNRRSRRQTVKERRSVDILERGIKKVREEEGNGKHGSI